MGGNKDEKFVDSYFAGERHALSGGGVDGDGSRLHVEQELEVLAGRRVDDRALHARLVLAHPLHQPLETVCGVLGGPGGGRPG